MLLLSLITQNECQISFVFPLNRIRNIFFADSLVSAMLCGLHTLIVLRVPFIISTLPVLSMQ